VHGRFPHNLSPDRTYDGVLFWRALHRIENVTSAIERSREILELNGKVVCVDFSCDLFGAGGALPRRKRTPPGEVGLVASTGRGFTGPGAATGEEGLA
jgi:hypothetical protein